MKRWPSTFFFSFFFLAILLYVLKRGNRIEVVNMAVGKFRLRACSDGVQSPKPALSAAEFFNPHDACPASSGGELHMEGVVGARGKLGCFRLVDYLRANCRSGYLVDSTVYDRYLSEDGKRDGMRRCGQSVCRCSYRATSDESISASRERRPVKMLPGHV
jgi:hypothetical protein